MKRASAAKPRAPPKKAKYVDAYKVAFEADFQWVGKSSLPFVQSVRFHCVCPFRQFIMITECTLLLSSRYKKWLTVSVIHRIWSKEECSNGGLAAMPTTTATNFFCLELGHWNFTRTLGTGTWYCQHC